MKKSKGRQIYNKDGERERAREKRERKKEMGIE